MDPEATLKFCQDSIDSADLPLATLYLFDYYRWRLHGGFQPSQGDSRASKLEDEILTRMESWGNIVRTMQENATA